MPRQTSNNSSQRRNISTTSPTIYEKKISTPPSHQTVDVKAPGILSSMKQGIGLGMGSELGHRIIGSFFGPSQVAQTQIQSQVPRSDISYLPRDHQLVYKQCLQKNEDFPEICKPFQTKDPSVWKQCMETHQFNHLECSQ